MVYIPCFDARCAVALAVALAAVDDFLLVIPLTLMTHSTTSFIFCSSTYLWCQPTSGVAIRSLVESILQWS
jgi:hypothetical protein